MKILMLGNGYPSIFRHRGELVEALVKEGHEVAVSFPDSMLGNGEEAEQKYKCRFIETPISRRTARIHEELLLIWRYYRLIKKEKPDAVLAYTVKCDVYGGIAAGLAHTPFIPNITGIGKGLAEKSIIQKILIRLYRISMKQARVVFFQNKSDKRFFTDNGIKFRRSVVLPGSGVNLEAYCPMDYPESSPVRFLFNSRIMAPKGIEQYIDAAYFIRQKYPDTEFHICGYFEEDKKGKTYRKIIEAEAERGTVIYHNLVNNMKDYYRMCHCVILPSYHPEGVPNVMLEAAACARPVITTNHPGCLETVEDGITGFLVQPRNSKDLASKIELFLSMKNSERRAMGLKGRQKMEKEFDRRIVIDAYMKEINGLM